MKSWTTRDDPELKRFAGTARYTVSFDRPAGDPSDWVIEHFDEVRPQIDKLAATGKRVPLTSVRLRAPVANPGKIIGAPINYAIAATRYMHQYGEERSRQSARARTDAG